MGMGISNIRNLIISAFFLIASTSILNAQCYHHDNIKFNEYAVHLCATQNPSSSKKEALNAWFTEVSNSSGISYEGISYSSAWGDINSDGYPDLFTGNHGTPIIFMNNKGNSFIRNDIPYYRDTIYYTGTDTLSQAQLDTIDPNLVDTLVPKYDLHTCGFIDFDNDNDNDLFIHHGTNGELRMKSNSLLLNQNKTIILDNKASEKGIDDRLGRSRGFLWFDQNIDGHSDLFLNTVQGGGSVSKFFQNNAGSIFTDLSNNINLDDQSTNFSFLNSVGKSQKLNLHVITSNKIREYDVKDVPFQLKQTQTTPNINDIAVNDLNGDLIIDYYVATGGEASEVRILNDTILLFIARPGSGENYFEVKFETQGPIQVYVDRSRAGIEARTFIGRNKNNPTSKVFELDPNDSNNQGIQNIPNILGTYVGTPGTYIGYLTGQSQWNIKVLDNNTAHNPVAIASSTPITNLIRKEFDEDDNLTRDVIFFQNEDGSYTEDRNIVNNSQYLNSTTSVVAEDFDNDMDIDIFLCNTLSTINKHNVILENDGNGNFTEISSFGGEGTLSGRGGTVISADYDNNGTMDVFTENGHGLFYNIGPLQLFKNNRTENNWLHINLEGVTSNKDAIGALVYCYAGGKGQVRLQQNGIHKFGQDHKRIHFGLGQNEIIDSLAVYWPSGTIQRFTEIEANNIIKIIENIDSVIVENAIVDTTDTTTTPIFNSYIKDLQIFPNPFNNQISIVPLNGLSDNNVKVSIYSISSGHRVYDASFGSFNSKIVVTDINIRPGSYILRIEGDKLNIVKELIKIE